MFSQHFLEVFQIFLSCLYAKLNVDLFKIIFTYKQVFKNKIFQKFVFYRCKQKNNNNIILQLDLNLNKEAI